MIIKEYIVKETSFDQLNDIITEFFGNNYGVFRKENYWTYIFKKDFPGYAFELPCKSSSSSGLWAGYRDSETSSWSDISAACSDNVKIRFYKEEGKFIYATGITSDNKEHYAGGFLENSSCFVWLDYIYYDYGKSNYLSFAPMTYDNYISLAPFFNPREQLSNPDYTNVFIPAIRPSLDGTYTVFNINSEKYATMSKNIFVKLESNLPTNTQYLVKQTNASEFSTNYESTTFTYDESYAAWKLDNNAGGTTHCQMVYWKVDTTLYSKAVAVLKRVEGNVGDANERTFQLRSSASSGSNPMDNILVKRGYEETTSPQTITLDISNIEGENFLAISIGGTIDAYVSEVYLQ